MKLKKLARAYVEEKDNSDHYNLQLTRRVHKFIDFCGTNPKPKKVKPEGINEWLSHLLATDLSIRTVRAYRGNLVAVLNYAAEIGLRKPLNTKRLKRIKAPRLIPEAWTKEQIQLLIESASMERDADYWVTWVMVGFDTGCRKADIMDFTEVSTEPWLMQENKTGNPRLVRVRQETVDQWDRLGDRTLMWTGDRHTWFRRARKIIERAGLPGTMKYLRRSHETHCGKGALGHRSAGVSAESYFDPRIGDKSTVLLP